MKFSTLNSIPNSTFFDPDLDEDSLRFIDPNTLSKVHIKGFDGNTVDNNIYSFLNALCNAYLNKDIQVAHQLLDVPHEENGTRIGYARTPNKGRGVSPEILDNTIQTILSSSINLVQVKHHPEFLSMLTQNFDKDRLSDLITSINCLELVRYTEFICNLYNVSMTPEIKIHYFDKVSLSWQSMKVALPTDKSKQPVILIPRVAVVEDYNFSAESFVQKRLLTIRQQSYKEQGYTLSKKKIHALEVRPLGTGMIKKYALQEILKDPSLLEEYLHLLRLTA